MKGMFSIYMCVAAILLLKTSCFESNNISYEDAVVINDIDGNKYKTIKIADQYWMAENLSVKHYSNGDPIKNFPTDDEWKNAGNKEIGAWSYYENDSTMDMLYGKLYNWYAINDERGLCPKGWKVPSDEDWIVLEKYLGMPNNESKQLLIERGVNENIGGKIKSKGTSHWDHPNSGATNQSGLSALPGGGREIGGMFYYRGNLSEFWTSTDIDWISAIYRVVGFDGYGIARGESLKHFGRSIRCIKEEK